MEGVQWPLGAQQHELLAELATLIARGGAWRFLHTPVVAADTSHYPEPWEPSRAGVGRVVARTLWHAHLGLDATVDDVRRPTRRAAGRLYATHFELAHVDASSAVFMLHLLGNDDIAGQVAHEVGRAFVGSMGCAGHPFRVSADGLPTPAIGSIAAVYLGLGVLAANAAFYSQAVGRYGFHQHRVVRAGGLEVDDLAFLLAVQATVRDDVLTALDTLHPTQRELVDAWRAVIDDHEVELLRMLGIAELGHQDAVARPDVPLPVIVSGQLDEGALHKENHGRRVFRYAQRLAAARAGLGMLCGMGVAAVIIVYSRASSAADVALLLLSAGFLGGVVGWFRGRRARQFKCASCRSLLEETDRECANCGGTVAGEIANPSDRLAREEELEEAERAEPGRAEPGRADPAAEPGTSQEC